MVGGGYDGCYAHAWGFYSPVLGKLGGGGVVWLTLICADDDDFSIVPGLSHINDDSLSFPLFFLPPNN